MSSSGYGRLFSKYNGFTTALSYRYEKNSIGLDSTFSYMQGRSSDVYQLSLSLCSFYKFPINKFLIGKVGLGPGVSHSKIGLIQEIYQPPTQHGNQYFSYNLPSLPKIRHFENRYYSLDTAAFIQVGHAFKNAPINSVGFTARAIQPSYFLHTKIEANAFTPKYPSIFLSVFLDY